MTPRSITYHGTIPRPIHRGSVDTMDVASEVANAYFKEFTQQIPVDRGDLRRSTRKVATARGYRVGPTLRRAIPLHQGTNRYRGSSFDFGERGGGRTRQARYSKEEIMMFAAIQKRTNGKGISIPPDKFRDRTYRAMLPVAGRIASREIMKQFARKDRL